MHNLPISKDAFFWALSITSQLHHIPLPSSVVMQRHQPPFTLGMFRLVATQRGLKVRQKAYPRSHTDRLPASCLVALHAPVNGSVDANVTASPLAREFQLALLLSMDEKGVVIVETCGGFPVTLSREVFAHRFTGEAILIAPADATETDSSPHGKTRRGRGAIATQSSRTGLDGFTWLIPRLRWLRAALRNAR
jgi:hypothetical protein